ncbi:hypothetical protein [Latilactobacillus sakei]|uniref:Uncharacterized protein n=1 Tax=Latilactobacillus sakei TaxID=1599 RepID=A0AAF0K9I4_LATSK|nr:hypothetical protein [Latilactobacillus sakei]WGI18545.1 hypothetical protein QBD03_07240 [Latilactobacillus sakei]
MKLITLGRTGMIVEQSGPVISFYGSYEDRMKFQNEALAEIWFDTLVNLIDAIPDFKL